MGRDSIAQGKPKARPWVAEEKSKVSQGCDSKAVLPWAMLSHPFGAKTKTLLV